MAKHFILFSLLLLFNSCNMVENEDRLEGFYARDPIVHFSKYYLTKFHGITFPEISRINTLHSNDTLAFFVAEFNRADCKPCPAQGSELSFEVETLKGDREKFYLDDDTGWLQHADNITPYLKILKYRLYNPERSIPVAHNHTVEVSRGGDKIIATYRSYWHGHVAKDTLFVVKSD
ncbi:MAG: hypothetical protein HF314_05245 [Ignavibacteria bacterium]|jgi:hypothetical protein|nr:hypothetical protein [Ignavibacteria bacterium]MCU7502456.1 hypothetical protein [Ignavibacteria bacterium]MCU7514979.1 hypothetical protein [Ignavibacteria bacterium]